MPQHRIVGAIHVVGRQADRQTLSRKLSQAAILLCRPRSRRKTFRFTDRRRGVHPIHAQRPCVSPKSARISAHQLGSFNTRDSGGRQGDDFRAVVISPCPPQCAGLADSLSQLPGLLQDCRIGAPKVPGDLRTGRVIASKFAKQSDL